MSRGHRQDRAEHRRGRTGRRRRGALLVVALVALSALLATACGSSGRAESSDPGSPDATSPSGSSGESFGTLESPCGEGDAKGATQQGVTDSSITIGYGDDAGYQAAPGLSHELSDAMEAMIKWCNEQGGINGRQVVGNYYDAKIFEVNNVMAEACKQVFMLVGEGWSGDSGQEETRLGCNLAAVPTYSVSASFANAKLMIQPVPNPIDYTPVEIAAAMQKQFPDKITKTAVMFANYASTIDTKDKVLESYPKFGFKFLDCPQQYNIAGESDWKPFAQNLKDCGAEMVYFTGSPAPNFENLLDAAKQIDYNPIWITDANFYDSSFAAWNATGNANNVYVRQAFTPLFEAKDNPAVQKYLDVVKGNGGDVNQLGMQATSAFLLWATGVKACESNVTSQCVMDELGKVTDWTGGGLHAKTNPASNKPPDCGLVLKMEGTEYTRYYPEEVNTFDCDPSYVVQVTGPVVDQANLDANRVSQPG